MESIQIIQVNPDQFRESLMESIKSQFSDLLKGNRSVQFTEEYLTRDEVSKMLKINISTVSNWSRDGILIKHCIGNRVYFKRSEIEKRILSI
jgi:hypothetical protein